MNHYTYSNNLFLYFSEVKPESVVCRRSGRRKKSKIYQKLVLIMLLIWISTVPLISCLYVLHHRRHLYLFFHRQFVSAKGNTERICPKCHRFNYVKRFQCLLTTWSFHKLSLYNMFVYYACIIFLNCCHDMLH